MTHKHNKNKATNALYFPPNKQREHSVLNLKKALLKEENMPCCHPLLETHYHCSTCCKMTTSILESPPFDVRSETPLVERAVNQTDMAEPSRFLPLVFG